MGEGSTVTSSLVYPGGLLMPMGASETVLVEEVDEVAALGALGDF
jgi:hypothetical protein